MWDDLQRGLFIGYAVSIPVGPIALLVIRRSVRSGRAAGVVSGLGAATVDLFCGTAAVLGLKGLTLVIEHHEPLIRLVGGLFLIGFGYHTLRMVSDPENGAEADVPRWQKYYFSTAGLTIANPLTWLGLIFVSAAAGASTGVFSLSKTIFTSLGICAASASWWVLLSICGAWLGQKLGTKILHWINLIAGGSLVGVGLFQIVQILRQHWP
jgi:threonine/homoserine/homoserine lactone efflux protein